MTKRKTPAKRKYTRKPKTAASAQFSPDKETPEQKPTDAPKADQVSEQQPKEDKDANAATLRAQSRGAAKNLTGLSTQKLLAPQRPGFVRRWVKDVGNRLAEVQRKGYSFVSKDEIDTQEVFSTDAGDKVSQVGGTDSGNPYRLYLMEISEEFAKEDAEEKEASRRETEDQIRRANVGPEGLSGSVMYNPNPHANHLKPPEEAS